MITLEQYMAHYAQYHRAHPHQRAGQAAFNALHDIEPEIANQVRGTDCDPFYRDSRMVAFTAWLIGRLDMEQYSQEVNNPDDGE